MNFYRHTQAWIKGEIFEGTIILIAGIAIIVLTFLFWKFGSTPFSKAIVLPILVIALILGSIGTSMIVSNNKRLIEMEKSYNKDNSAFVDSEKIRIEGFMYMYTMSKYIALVCFLVALAFFFFTENRHLQAIGIALIIFGFSSLLIDYFSKERADMYYEQVMIELNSDSTEN